MDSETFTNAGKDVFDDFGVGRGCVSSERVNGCAVLDQTWGVGHYPDYLKLEEFGPNINMKL